MKKDEAVDILKKELALVMRHDSEKAVQSALVMAIRELEKGIPPHPGGRVRCRCGMDSVVESELFRKENKMTWRITCESGHIKTMWCYSPEDAAKQWKIVMG